ncbi:multiple sugar transport system substrate-binding protein [Kribbella aluminosa]|uniref:Multiple sugar transport system substrate-binding protein n=1 Tax=Kribbella aluminosa TaxID=416017 RepID=A0ABS4UJI1_9ACTN|nr:sugar ABC transporter substrate-binding protein [Kribbella aluminosa]MBP2351803.1 multiple sugar transport system substrate-binding protein [Kribbella aluminosa]
MPCVIASFIPGLESKQMPIHNTTRRTDASSLPGRRTFLGLVGAAGTGLLTGACSTGGGGSQSSGSKSFTWATWAGVGDEKKTWDRVAALAAKDHPGTTVTIDASYATNYYDTLVTRTVAGRGPDLMTSQGTTLPSLVDRGLLQPLDDRIKNDSHVAAGDWPDAIRQAMSWDGKQYLLPYDVGPCFLWYNKDLLASVGVAEPSATEPMTYAEFRTICSKVAKSGNRRYGYATPPAWDYLIPWVWSAGGEMMNPDRTACELSSPGATTGLDNVVSLYRDGLAAPIKDLTKANALEDFASGTIAFTPGGPWDAQYLRTQNLKFTWGFMPFPAGDGGSQTWVSGSGFGIAKTVKQIDAAFAALTSLVSPAAQQIMASAGRAFPARASAISSYSQGGKPPAHVNEIGVLMTAKGTRPYITTPNWQQINTMLSRDLMPILLPGAKLDDILAKVTPQFTDLLKKG